MELKSLGIREGHKWEKEMGYVGVVEFEGDLGTVKLKLTDDISRKILEICSDDLMAASRQVADAMLLDLVPRPPAIEHHVPLTSDDSDPIPPAPEDEAATRVRIPAGALFIF